MPKVSICIASHNMRHLLSEAIASALKQEYRDMEIIVLDDASEDNTKTLGILVFPEVKYFRSDEPSGTGGAFNKAIEKASGEYIILLCADDVFANNKVVGDIVDVFEKFPKVGHVSRYYYQFMDEYNEAVRAWHCDDVIELANNPSGLAFRKSAIAGLQLSNKMFVEAAVLVHDVLNRRWDFRILGWDTVAVRIHKSISRDKNYYRKRWVSSPVEEWTKLGGFALQNDFTSLIQIKNYFTLNAVLKECWNFIRLHPATLIHPGFIFFALVSIFTPRFLLIRIPDIYRRSIGRWMTQIIPRPG